MPTTLTWQEPNQPAKTLSVPDEWQAKLEAYRLAQTYNRPVTTVDANGNSRTEYQQTPIYATVFDMIAGVLSTALMRPVMKAQPPDAIAQLRVAAAAQAKAADDAETAALTAIFTPTA